MSLRTKLLAAIVGLPVAILLLALVLFVRRGPTTPMAAIDRVIEDANRGSRLEIGQKMQKHLLDGHFHAGWVARSADGKDTESRPAVWSMDAYYTADGSRGTQVEDPVLRAELVKRFRRVVGRSPPIKVGARYLIVRAHGDDDARRPYGFIFELHPPLRTAQTVYWVMVGGIALLMVVLFWVVSRWVIRPLRALSDAADRIAGGDYRVQIEPHASTDEFGRTIRALNRMAREIAEYQGHLEDRVLTALSRIKRAEQHLTIAQRLAATGKLASGLAHEINNPLGGMKNAVRALARGDLPPEKTALYLDLVADGLTRVEQMVKKFLSFTPRRAQPRHSDLADVAEKSVALGMHRLLKRGIDVELDVPSPGEAMVFGDPHELQQVALNLVLNAADAMPAGSDGSIHVQVQAQEDVVLLRVRDDGVGMSQEDQQRCFDMFFTTKDVGEGSGMGLAVVHNIVTNHGGRIELTSNLGEGTTFDVFLPREAEGPGAVGPAVPGDAATAQQG